MAYFKGFSDELCNDVAYKLGGEAAIRFAADHDNRPPTGVEYLGILTDVFKQSTDFIGLIDQFLPPEISRKTDVKTAVKQIGIAGERIWDATGPNFEPFTRRIFEVTLDQAVQQARDWDTARHSPKP